jgi:hypothetical protein
MGAANDTAGPQVNGAAKIRPQQTGLEHVSADSRPWSAIGVHVLLEGEDWNCNLHGVSGLTRELRRGSHTRSGSPSPENSIGCLGGESRQLYREGCWGTPSRRVPGRAPCRCPSHLSERATRALSRAGTHAAQRAKSRPGCGMPRRGFAERADPASRTLFASVPHLARSVARRCGRASAGVLTRRISPFTLLLSHGDARGRAH